MRVVAISVLSCLLLFGLYASGTVARLPINDFYEYWAAAHLIITHHNPYSQTAMHAEEERLGLRSGGPLMMWNPPWVLPFVAPLALLHFETARTLMFGLSFVIVFGCADWLWTFYSGGSQQRWIAWLLTFSFAPAIVALASGQLSPLLLLGVCMFLRFVHQKSYFAAGASMLLVAFKPHLLYLLWIALGLWAAKSPRRWQTLLGAVLSLTVTTAVALTFDHAALAEYMIAWKSTPLLALYAPAMGGLLRSIFGWQLHSLQFLPALVGIAWWLWHWKRISNDFSWSRCLPILLTVSIFTSPYTWLFDEVVLLPSLIERAVSIRRAGKSLPLLWIAAYFAANAGIFLLLAFGYGMMSRAFAWSSPLWLLLYLVTGRHEDETLTYRSARSPASTDGSF